MKSLLLGLVFSALVSAPVVAAPIEQIDVNLYRYALEQEDEGYEGGTIRATRLMTDADGSNWVGVYVTPKACKADEAKNERLMNVLREVWNSETNYGKPTTIIAVTTEGCQVGGVDTEGGGMVVHDKKGNPVSK